MGAVVVLGSCSAAPKPVAPLIAAHPPALPDVATPAGYVVAEQRRTEEPTITVTDPGRSPRRYLAFTPAVGSHVAFAVDADRGPNGPRIRYRIEREIVAVESGWITYRGTLRALEYVPRPTDPEEWQALTDVFPTFVGAFEVGQVSVLGQFERAKTYKPEAGSNVFSELLINFAAFNQVPPEPLGPGARWKSVYDFSSAVDTTEYRIVDWNGARVSIEGSDSSVGPQQSGHIAFAFEFDLARGTARWHADSTVHIDGKDVTAHMELTMDPQ